jgi:alanine dehydrogenase
VLDIAIDPLNKEFDMLVGVLKEIKNHEYRVGLTPASVVELVARGHRVMVEMGAGVGIDFSDDEYLAAGDEMVAMRWRFLRRRI